MIAVTGASGWIGGALCAWLRAQGQEVRGLSRSASGPTDRAFDLTAPDGDEQWRTALQGCDTLVHCAAHVHRPREDERERALFAATNADGTARLVRVCQAAGIRRIVYASSIAVYDWSQGVAARSERDAVSGSTAYAQSKLAGETAVKKFSGDWRIARLATVYGAGDRANFSRLAHALRRRRFVIPGDGRARKSVIEVTRAAELLGLLALHPAAAGTVVNLAAPSAPTLREICGGFGSACGFPPAIVVPAPLLRIMAKLGDVMQKLVGKAPLTSQTLAKITTDSVVETQQLSRLFPQVVWPSFAESLQTSAEYYRSV
jgi:UDP-glucose 4-epimerase